MDKPQAKISTLEHRGHIFLKVEFENTYKNRDLIKQVKGRKWSQTHRCWYIPDERTSKDQLNNLFQVITNNKKEAKPQDSEPRDSFGHNGNS